MTDGKFPIPAAPLVVHPHLEQSTHSRHVERAVPEDGPALAVEMARDDVQDLDGPHVHDREGGEACASLA